MLGCFNNRSQQLKKLAKVTAMRLAQTTNLEEKETTTMPRKRAPMFRIKDSTSTTDSQSTASGTSGESSQTGKKKTITGSSRNSTSSVSTVTSNTMVSPTLLPKIQKQPNAGPTRPPLGGTAKEPSMTNVMASKENKEIAGPGSRTMKTKPREPSNPKQKMGGIPTMTGGIGMQSTTATATVSYGNTTNMTAGGTKQSKVTELAGPVGRSSLTKDNGVSTKTGSTVSNPSVGGTMGTRMTGTVGGPSYMKTKPGPSPMKTAPTNANMNEGFEGMHQHMHERGKITKGDQSPMIEESKEMMMNRKLLDAGDQHSEKEEEEEEEE